jgi:hypothetical protein
LLDDLYIPRPQSPFFPPYIYIHPPFFSPRFILSPWIFYFSKFRIFWWTLTSLKHDEIELQSNFGLNFKWICVTVGVIPRHFREPELFRKKNNYLHNSLLSDKFVYYDERFLFRLIEPISSPQ